jgi:ribulose bisphosphate carboxylase small subunit
MVSDKDTLYMKIIALDEIYKFLVLSFVICDC